MVGAAVELGLSYSDNSHDHVNNGTYIAFLVLGASGAVIAALMQHPGKLVKADGTRQTNTSDPAMHSAVNRIRKRRAMRAGPPGTTHRPVPRVVLRP